MATLMDYRLIPDMYPFSKQVQIACDKARSVVARLARMEVPCYEDNEKTLAELKVRIALSVEFIRSVPPEPIDGTEYKEIVLPVTHAERLRAVVQRSTTRRMPELTLVRRSRRSPREARGLADRPQHRAAARPARQADPRGLSPPSHASRYTFQPPDCLVFHT